MQNSLPNKIINWRYLMRICLLQWIIMGVLTSISFAREGSAQAMLNKNISVKFNNISIEKALDQIQNQSDIKFIYSSKVSLKERISFTAEQVKISDVLDEVLTSNGIVYAVINNQIILTRKKTIKNSLIPVTMELNATTSSAIYSAHLLKGKVVSSDGEGSLPGVSIIMKGTSSGTTTDINGNYELDISNSKAILVFSFVGYVSQEVSVGTRTNLDVTLLADSKALEELVVVGYGTQKRVNLTGAVTQVQAQDLENRPLVNMSQILQGMVPNLNINFSTGQPGAGGSLNIRGETSINGGGPLVMIDGVPGDINRINPSDVESVSVLKDAAAAAIYGARGAFGVILVTTKTAKNGKTTISYTNNFGWGKPTVSTDFMTSGYDQVMLNDEAFKRATGNTYTRYSEEDYKELEARRFDKTEDPSRPWVVVKNKNGKDIYNYYGNYDWWNTVFDMSQPSRQHNLSISGGNTKMDYFLSGSVYEKDGIMRINKDKFQSYTLRAKINAQLKPWLKISNNTQYYDNSYTYPGREGGANNNFVAITVHALPAYAPRNPDGTATYNTLKNNYSIGDGLFASLLGGVSGGEKRVHEFRTINTATIDFTKNWNLVANHSYSFYMADDYYRSAVAKYSIQPGILAPVPNYNVDQLKKTFWFDPTNVVNVYTAYNQTFGKHYFGLTAGINSEQMKHQRLFGARKNLLSESLNDLNLGTGEQLTDGDSYEYALFGAFFRANYDYEGKYLFEINGRYDGTSRFGAGRRYGFFPSVSAGWRISEEKFFENTKNVINNLKFRASYGTLGNQLPSNNNSSSYYPYISTMPTSQSSWLNEDQKLLYVNNPRPIAPNLTWEKATTTNFGIDAGMLKNRLNLSMDIYSRKTTDMLVPGQVLPSVFGASVPTQNAGDLETKGFELAINWKDQFQLASKPFSYGVSAMISDYTSKITKYDNPNNILSSRYVGQSIGEIWGYSIGGLFRSDQEAADYAVDQTLVNTQIRKAPGDWSRLQAGDVKFLDLDGDNKITQGANTLDNHGDLKIIGNSNPRYRIGFNLSANWNGIDFSGFVQGIIRRDWYPGNNADKFWGPYSRPYYSFVPKDFEKDVWTPENPDAYFPLLRGYVALNGGGELNVKNDRYLQNAGYIRLKNIVIGYTIPTKLTEKIKLSKVRFYVSGENLLTGTKLRTQYIDPEQLDGDYTNGRTYPLSKTVSVGLNVNF